MKQKIISFAGLLALSTVISAYVAGAIYRASAGSASPEIGGQSGFPSAKDSIAAVFEYESCRNLFVCIEIILVIAIIFLLSRLLPAKAKTVKIAGKFDLPIPAGQGQHGSAWFLSERLYKKKFGSFAIDENSGDFAPLFACGDDHYQEIEDYLDEKPCKVREPPSLPTPIPIPPKTSENENKNLSLAAKINGVQRTKSEQNDVPEPIPPPIIKTKPHELRKSKIKGGVVVGTDKKSGKIYCLDDDMHTLVIGATRCGKTRGLVLQTIIACALAGESIVCSDPKGELYLYCKRLLEKLGYKIRVVDFMEMDKSDCFNPLQYIIDAAKKGDIDSAQIRTMEFVNLIVEKSDHAEPIWRNSEMSVIAGAILAVVIDNIERPELQNLTNVYEFIANMSREVPNPKAATDKNAPKMLIPLKEYMASLPDDHPAKSAFAPLITAPDRTAGSFYTSALTTLYLYTVKGVYNITRKSDFSMERLGIDKEAFFYILPDQSTTFYPVATLMIGQQYERLVTYAKIEGKRTNRLPRRVNFVLDEFGNFSKINDFNAKMTVGAGYGIRFALFVQGLNQLIEKYGKESASIIKGNCAAWVYLSTQDLETAQELEKMLGNYTTVGYSSGVNMHYFHETGTSSSGQLVGRPLLSASDLQKLSRPYQLLFLGSEETAVMYAPDLSKWQFNRILGLGDKEHNKGAISLAQSERGFPALNSAPPKLWGIWKRYGNQSIQTATESEVEEELRNQSMEKVDANMLRHAKARTSASAKSAIAFITNSGEKI